MSRRTASPAISEARHGTGEPPCDEFSRLSRLALEVAADFCIWGDREGRIVYANEAACRSLGYTKDELYSMKVSDFDTYYDETKYPVAWEKIKKLGSIKAETVYRRKDGSLFPVEMTVSYLRLGETEYLVDFIRDITRRRQAEDALKEAKAQAELYLDLLSHDINNMHQIALGYLELAQGLPQGKARDEMVGKSVEVLQRSALLIRNVRKLQMFHDGAFPAQVIDVVPMLAEVQREFGAVPGKSITLNDNGHAHCYVRANELLHDVFANLVSNAIRHTGTRAKIVVDVDRVVEDRRPFCRISVEDDGPGIPDQSKARVFDRMQKGSGGGTGIGLFLVRSLVESYDGKVSVEDRVEGDHTRGVRFVVAMPAAD